MGGKRKLQKTQGYCIVCQTEIPYNLYSPVCEKCKTTKAQDSAEIITCHRCTKQMTRPEYYPLCDVCYQQASYVR